MVFSHSENFVKYAFWCLWCYVQWSYRLIWRLRSPLHIPHGVIDPRVPLCGLCRFGVEG